MMSRFTRNFIIVSLVHVLLVAGVVVFSVRSCRRKPRPPEITNYIDLVVSLPPSPEPPAPEPVKPPPKVEPAPPKISEPPPAPPKIPEPVPEPAPKKPKRPKIEVSKTVVTRQPEKRPAVSEDEIKRLLKETLKTSDAQPSAPIDFAWYYAMVRDQMYSAWKQPGTVSRSAGLVTRMLITVNRSGDVLNSRMLASSGNPGMDQSVLDAVSAVRKLPQLPANMPGATKEITVDFELTDRF